MSSLFISYTQDSPARKAEVLALAQALRKLGLDVKLDQDFGPSGPPTGWPAWSGEISEKSPRVLCIASKDYRDCWHGNKLPGIKNGATHEALTLQNRLYDGGARTDFLRFAFFAKGDEAFIPTRVKGLTYFNASDYASIATWVQGTSLPIPPLPPSPPIPASTFDVQKPAVPPAFVGRQRQLRLIEHLVEEGGGVSLVADARMGKSSLLATLKARLALTGKHPVCLVDSQDLDGFRWHVIVRQFTGGAVTATAAQCDGADAAASHIAGWVKRQPARPVILADEGEGLIHHLEVRFFERLRGLLQTKSLCLVFATRQELPDLFQQYHHTTSPFGNTMPAERLGLLDEADAQTLAERASLDSGLLRLWAGESPYYLQLLGWALAEGPDEATTLQRFRDTAANQLSAQWHRLKPGEQKGLQDAISGLPVNPPLLPGLHERGLLTAAGQPFGKVLTWWLQRKNALEGHG